MVPLFGVLLLCVFANTQAATVVTVSTLYNISWTQAATLKATVIPTPPTPFEKVRFFLNATLLGSGNLIIENGVAVSYFKYKNTHGPPRVDKIVAKYKLVKDIRSKVLNLFILAKKAKVTSKGIVPLTGINVGDTITINIAFGKAKINQPPAFPVLTEVFFLLDKYLPITCNTPVDATNPFECKWTIPTTVTTGPHTILAYSKGKGIYGGASVSIPLTIGCPPSLVDCNNDRLCETSVFADANNCLGCGNKCNLTNTDVHTCSNAGCGVSTCDPGFGDCTGVSGCETSLKTMTNCGSCGQGCGFPHASASCSTGSCIFGSCDVGFGNCDANVVSNGCEKDLKTITDCGSCGTLCARNNANTICTNGCQLQSCKTNFGNCDSDDLNGCEFKCNENIVYDTGVTNYPATDLTCQQAVDNLHQGLIPRKGTGTSNGRWVTNTFQGIEIGLRAEERSLGNYAPLFDNVYRTVACASAYSTQTQFDGSSLRAHWSYGISVDLSGATGTFAATTFADYDIQLVIEIASGTQRPGFPITLDVKKYHATNLIAEICACSQFPTTGTFDINGDLYDASSCNLKDDPNALNSLKRVQDSSNLQFNFEPNQFDYQTESVYKLTLTLTPKSANFCDACPLNVTMLVLVLAPDSGKCPQLNCNTAAKIDCDGDGLNGCEVLKFEDENNCGSCGTTCQFDNVLDPTCGQDPSNPNSAVCSFTNCKTNYYDCDASRSNGCEWDCLGSATTVLDGNAANWVVTATCPAALNFLLAGKIPRFGTGVPNGHFTLKQFKGIELGLRAEERKTGNNLWNGAQNRYKTYACHSAGGTTQDNALARWNYAFSIDFTASVASLNTLQFGDFNFELKIFSQSQDKFILTEDPLDFVPGLATDILSKANCGATFPQTVNGKQFDTAAAFIGAKGNTGDSVAPKLTLVQESTNIVYQLPAFDFTVVDVYTLTLTATPKPSARAANCACPLSVSIIVEVQAAVAAACT